MNIKFHIVKMDHDMLAYRIDALMRLPTEDAISFLMESGMNVLCSSGEGMHTLELLHVLS